MARVSVRCCYQGCHKNRKLTIEYYAELKEEAAGLGAKLGLICPTHFVQAIDETQRYSVDDVPLGELLVEVSKETPRWRIVWLPPE